MALKSHLTPLNRIQSLDERQLADLRRYSVTTVEELVGLLEANPQSVAELLHLDSEQIENLKAEAYALLPSHVRDELQRQKGTTYPMGALPPYIR